MNTTFFVYLNAAQIQAIAPSAIPLLPPNVIQVDYLSYKYSLQVYVDVENSNHTFFGGAASDWLARPPLIGEVPLNIQ